MGLKKHLFLAEADEDMSAGDAGGNVDAGDAVKKTIEKERQRARDAVKAYNELKSQFADIDVEEYKALKESSGKQKKAEADTIAKQTKQIEMLTQQANTYKQRYEQMIVSSEIAKAFNEMGGKASSPGSVGYQKIIETIVRDQVKYEMDEDGSGRLIVVDARGGEQIDKKGNVVTLKTLMAQLREDDALSYCFNPDNGNAAVGGMGSPNNRTNNKSNKSLAQLQREIIADTSLTPEQKMAKAQSLGIS